MLHVTTSTGSVYRIDHDEGLWYKNDVISDKICYLEEGDEKVMPGDRKTPWVSTTRPTVGKHMFICGLTYFFVTTKIVSVEEVQS